MRREFKPGDIIHDPRYGKVGIVVPAHIAGCPKSHEGLHIHYADGDWNRGLTLHRCRPLLVLDPNDGLQMTRLAEALRNVSGNLPIYADDVAAALRSLLDPKPEEPKGHLAVVVDRRGVRWVNWRDPSASYHHLHERPWVNANDPDECREYADIDVAEILSHGVPEDGVR